MAHRTTASAGNLQEQDYQVESLEIQPLRQTSVMTKSSVETGGASTSSSDDEYAQQPQLWTQLQYEQLNAYCENLKHAILTNSHPTPESYVQMQSSAHAILNVVQQAQTPPIPRVPLFSPQSPTDAAKAPASAATNLAMLRQIQQKQAAQQAQTHNLALLGSDRQRAPKNAYMIGQLTVEERQKMERREIRRKRRRAVGENLMCKSCGTTESPEWRRGPEGARSLCNACGLIYAKMRRNNQEIGDQFGRSRNNGNAGGSGGSGGSSGLQDGSGEGGAAGAALSATQTV